MRAKEKIIILVGIMMLLLSGCCTEHDWTEATCTTPQTCNLCGKTGSVLGEHKWVEANCMTPKTCEVCQETTGEKGEHDFSPANCTRPAMCRRCAATEGEALPHDFKDATCTTPKTCRDCKATEGDALGHDMTDATCTEKAQCTRCKTTDGDALGHDYKNNVCTRCEDKMIENYDELISYLNENYHTLITKVGTVKDIKYEIEIHDPNYLEKCDFELQIMAGGLYADDMKSSLSYIINYGDAFEYDDRIQAFIDILDFEMEVIKIAEAAFPDKKFATYYYQYGYEYPSIQVGFNSTTYFPFFNFRDNGTGKNGYVGTKLCDWYMDEDGCMGIFGDDFIGCSMYMSGGKFHYTCKGIHEDVMKRTDYDLRFPNH